MMSLSAWYCGWRARTVSRLRARLSSLHHAHFKIAKGIGWTLFFVVIARLIGAGREMAMAAHYGVSEIVDAYLFVFNLLSWPFTVWFSALSVVLVPTVMRLHHNGDGAVALQRFRSGLLGVSIIIGIIFATLFWLLLSTGLLLPYIGFPASTAALARTMANWLAPMVPFGFVVSFYSAWVMATGRYINTLIEAVPPLAIMVAVILFANGGVVPLASGTLVGFILQVLMLVAVLRKSGETTAPVFTGGGPEWRQFWRNIGVMATGHALIAASVVIDQVMAAALDPGTIATLGYANRIVALMLSLIALTVNRSILPIFSGMRAGRDPSLSRLAMQWSAFLFLGGAATAIVALWFAPSLVAQLFQRGAFTAENTRAVSAVFSFALFQIPFYCGGLVLTALLGASGRYGMIASLAATNLLVKIMMNWLLIPSFGAAGIALATGVMYALSFLVKTFLVSRYNHRLF